MVRDEVPSGPQGRFEVRPVIVRTALPPGSVLEGGAAAGLLAGAEPLGGDGPVLVTGLVPGARAAVFLEEAYVGDVELTAREGGTDATPVLGARRSGLWAEVGEDGGLRLRWTTTPRWDRVRSILLSGALLVSLEVPVGSTHEARLVPGPGERLAVLAGLADGRSAAALVRFDPEEAAPGE
jgi:hypothetical protein